MWRSRLCQRLSGPLGGEWQVSGESQADGRQVDSWKYLPSIIAAYYQATDQEPELPIPWTPVDRPLASCKFGLVTSGGLYQSGIDPPFDVERERREPTWGDPSYRVLPVDVEQADVGVSHLHYNPKDVLQDLNVLLPIRRFRELAAEGRIAGLAERSYSFMGSRATRATPACGRTCVACRLRRRYWLRACTAFC